MKSYLIIALLSNLASLNGFSQNNFIQKINYAETLKWKINLNYNYPHWEVNKNIDLSINKKNIVEQIISIEHQKCSFEYIIIGVLLTAGTVSGMDRGFDSTETISTYSVAGGLCILCIINSINFKKKKR